MTYDANWRLLTEASREGDLLQHRPLARALAKIIRDTPAKESLGLALYGAWGQGKSMIGKLIEECLEPEISSGKYIFVRVEAWKYAHEGERQPLRRHYLLRAYEAAGLKKEAARLRRAFAQKIISEAVDERGRTTEIFKTIKARVLARKPEILVTGFVLVTLLVIYPHAVFSTMLAAVGVIGAILVATSVMFETVLRVLATGLTVTTQEDPFRSVEEFDHQFTTFLTVDAKDAERFIFFIDDLDRCDDAIVVEAIETLQAFFGRERCTYFVAADEGQLKRAVRARSSGPVDLMSGDSTIPTDETFLEKIFQVSVHVPPLYPETLLGYARRVSEDTIISDLDDVLREDLLDHLIHPEVVSPRQARVIINDFLVVHFEAKEREAEADVYLAGDRLTSDPLLLAKMSVLRSHFPWFFNLLYSRPELLLDWPGTFEADATSWTEEQADADRAVREAAQRSVGEAKAFARSVTDERDAEHPAAESGDVNN